MKSRIQALSKASNDELLHTAILQSILTEVENNEQLEKKIGEILPFLSDGDRNIRQQALTILAFFNSQFHIPIVQSTIAEMATIKLSDPACLEISCGIISANIQYITDKEKVAKIFTTLINSDLRANLYKTRLSAYKNFDTLISLHHPQVDGIDEYVLSNTQTAIDSFKKFCGYEQDPRCLTVVFEFFPKFSEKVLLNKAITRNQKNELFDVVGAFFPITQKEELASELSIALSSLSAFSDDLAALVSLKLKNSLADTRSPVYASLPLLLVHDNTSSEHVASVVSSFIASLSDHFDSDSTSASETVVNSAIDAVTNFVRINAKCHELIKQIALNDWIDKIVSSVSATEIRAFSVVIWSIEKVLHFSEEAMKPLSEKLTKSLKINDESRIQSILASVVEYLKIQDSSEKVETPNIYLKNFYDVSQKVLTSENRNLTITALVFMREYLKHFVTPADESLIPKILDYLNIKPFATQCLISLASQANYSDLLKNQFINPLIEAILNKSSFYGINTSSSVVEFASKFTNIPTFSEPLFEAIAKAGDFKYLSSSILSQANLEDSVATCLLDTLKCSEGADDLILIIALRSSDDVLKAQLAQNYSDASNKDQVYTRHKELIFSALKPASVPSDYYESGQITTEKLNLLYSAKLTTYPAGFTPNRLALAVRNTINSDLKPGDINQLFDFENQFDSALGETFSKFDLIESRFVYKSDYKESLWEKWHKSLIDQPEFYLKLCLLCPPSFFASELSVAIPLFQSFMKCDAKGSLDLLIFTIMAISDANADSEENINCAALIDMFSNQVDLIFSSLLELTDAEKVPDARVRQDACRILNLLPLAVPIEKLAVHKSMVLRKMKKVLDDPKRAVRQIAAQANMMWIKIGE